MTDETRTEQELRRLLATRAATVQPVDLHDGVVRSARRQRAVVAAGLTAALVAVGVPAALAASGVTGTGPEPAATPTPTGIPARASCGPSGPGRVPQAAPWPRRPYDPRLPVQRDVAGSLGGDEDVVRAVAWAAWDAFEGSRDGPLDPARTRVHFVQRAEDGWIVGLVTAGDERRGSFTRGLVVGPDAGRLGVLAGGFSTGAGPLPRTLPGGDVYVGVTSGCGPERAVVFAPPGSTGEVTWVAGVSAAGDIDLRRQAVPLRPDGVGVIARPSPQARLTVRVLRDGKPLASTWFQGTDPHQDWWRTIEKLAPAAPGDAAGRAATSVLGSYHSHVPVRMAEPRILWAGTEGAYTAGAAASALPSGAHYVWGGYATRGKPGILGFDGLVPAGALDRTAYRFRAPGPDFVFFTGTRQVRVGSQTRTVTGGLLVPHGAPVTVLDGGVPMPLVDARTGLKPVEEPR